MRSSDQWVLKGHICFWHWTKKGAECLMSKQKAKQKEYISKEDIGI